jgi:hypothetical protein
MKYVLDSSAAFPWARHLIIELERDGVDYLVHTDATGAPLAQT